MASWSGGHLDVFFCPKCSSLFLVCLGCCCLSCPFWFYFKNLTWFLRSSISLSLSIDVCFVVEGILLGDFPRRCSAWAGCSNSSFFKRVGGSSWTFACFSQMLNFWIDDVGYSLNGICIRFLEVCLSYCRCLFIYWLGFLYILYSWTFSISLVAASAFVLNNFSMFRNFCFSVEFLKVVSVFLMLSFVDLMVFSQQVVMSFISMR